MIKTIELPFRSTVYHSIPVNASIATPILVFIPGNPGFIEYYTHYLDLLAESTGFEMLGISQAGFCTVEAETTNKIYTLNEQIDHKIDIMKQYTDNHREVYIFGHSVGSWIMQRIVERTSDIWNYKLIGFVTPTILDIHKSTKGAVMFPIVKQVPWCYKVVGQLSRVISALPDRVIKLAVGYAIDSKFQGATEITTHFVSNHRYIEQSIGLATEELLTIHSDWEYHQNFFKKFESTNKWIFLTSPDHWVSYETQKDIEKSLENSNKVLFTRDDNIRHSFCISQSDIFADLTNEAITHYS
jgi:pimeloyl-ACP methyl ester carboxylesterase